MLKNMPSENGSETLGRVQECVRKLPVTNMAVAGLLGAGAIALMSFYGPFSRRR